MASQGYYDWLAAGKPYTLIRPCAAVQRNLKTHGLTVWDYPDESHLKANTPEDHTPFSVTGFPGTNKRWKARGLDIMPRSDSYAHRKENADIARQLIRDRDAGVPGAMWIKYINWTDENGTCRQERWTSADPMVRTTRSSTDKGHVHVSGRSDADNDARADAYDPFTRMQQGVTTDMDLTTKVKCADGDERPIWQLILDVWNGFYHGGGEANPANVAQGGYAAKYERSIWAGLKTILSASGGSSGTGITHEQLVAAMKDALKDPEIRTLLVGTSFEGAQQAEKQ